MTTLPPILTARSLPPWEAKHPHIELKVELDNNACFVIILNEEKLYREAEGVRGQDFPRQQARPLLQAILKKLLPVRQGEPLAHQKHLPKGEEFQQSEEA